MIALASAPVAEAPVVPVTASPGAGPGVATGSPRPDLRFFIAAALLGLAGGIALGVKLAEGREVVKTVPVKVPCDECADRAAEEKRSEAARASRNPTGEGDDAPVIVADIQSPPPAASESANGSGSKVFSHMEVAPGDSSVPDDFSDVTGAMMRARAGAAGA